MTLLLTRSDVADLLPMDACIEAVEHAFRLHDLGRRYFAAKTNANFPDNPARFDLPTIQGVVLLADADNGSPLALMDSGEITALRTGAATAVAARYLARGDAAVATVCGCGRQGRIQLRALAAVRSLTRAYAVDRDPARAVTFAREMSTALGFEVSAVLDLDAAVRASDICVTCTPSKEPILHCEAAAPGVFIAAIGADNEDKQELDPALMAASAIVVDVLEQAAAIGDLHHALAAGAVATADVRAELGQVVAGVRPGRRSENEVIIFDSTGMALQDVAAAAAVYERAMRAGRGVDIDLAA